MVPESARILKRFYWLQRELVRLQAGWLPGVEHWPTKLLIPEFLWQDAEICTQLRQRVLELRYPLREIDLPPDESLVALWCRLADAPDAAAFVVGLREIVKPLLHRAFSDYLQRTDHLDDGPTVRILKQAVEDIDEQLVRWDEALADGVTGSTRTEAWRQGMAQWAKALGGLLETSEPIGAFNPSDFGGKPFSISRLGRRDSRFRCLKFAWPDMLDPSVGPGEGLQLQVRQAIHHINEVWASEMAAACFYDLIDEGDHEFFADAARWCYDEIRHCRMGFTRLKEWGFALDEMPLCSYSYDAGAKADALTRLGIIFYFESTYIHTKPQRMKIFGQAGDRVSSHDMDFDWADEQIHAHYGTRWLNHFLNKRSKDGDPMSVRQQAEKCIEDYRRSATVADRDAAARTFELTMERARQLIDRSAASPAG